jgi:modulator of FtsH protease
MDKWENFAVLVGGASAALTGLLFVAVSLNLDRFGESALLRAAAAMTLNVLVSPLLIAILIAIPGQTPQALGLELIGS